MKRLHVHVAVEDIGAKTFLTTGESTIYGTRS